MQPSFPKVPAGVWSQAEPDPKLNALMGRWGIELGQYLSTSEAQVRLTPSLADLLHRLVTEDHEQSYQVGCHGLPTFPRDVVGAGFATQVLLWRLVVVDFLEDIWDTIGPPLFGIDETREAVSLLSPPYVRGRCNLCFEPAEDNHYEVCSARLARRALAKP